MYIAYVFQELQAILAFLLMSFSKGEQGILRKAAPLLTADFAS